MKTVGEPVNQIAVQLAVIVAKAARFDVPREWPELLPALSSAVQDSNDSDTDGNIGSAKQELAPQQAGAHVGSSTAEGVVGEKIKVGQHCVSIHKQHQSGASYAITALSTWLAV